MEQAPLSVHLWYLFSLIIVYCVMLLYCEFNKNLIHDNGYTYLYLFSACAVLFSFAFGLKMGGAGLETSFLVYRNSLFFGLPMFSMGVFIHQHEVYLMRLLPTDKYKTCIIIAICVFMSLLQWFGIGPVEMPVATFFMVPFILLSSLRASRPDSPSKGRIIIGKVLQDSSVFIYLFHILVSQLLIVKLGYQLEGTALLPIAVLCVSCFGGVCVSGIRMIIRNKEISTIL